MIEIGIDAMRPLKVVFLSRRVSRYALFAFYLAYLLVIPCLAEDAVSDEPDYSRTDAFLENADRYEAWSNKERRASYKERINEYEGVSKKTKELAYALVSDDFETADALAPKADLHAKMESGGSFLLHCINWGGRDYLMPGRIRWITEHNADVGQIIYRGEGGHLQADNTFVKYQIFVTPIEKFAYFPWAIPIFAKRDPAGLDRKNPRTSQTLLGQTAGLGYEKSVEVLLAYGASIDLPGENDETPLVQAIKTSHYETALMLVSYGANTDVPIIDREMNRQTGIVEDVKYNNALDYLTRSAKTIREAQAFADAPHKSVRFNAKEALISLLKRLESPKSNGNNSD